MAGMMDYLNLMVCQGSRMIMQLITHGSRKTPLSISYIKKYSCHYLLLCLRVSVELLDCFCCYNKILEGNKFIKTKKKT